MQQDNGRTKSAVKDLRYKENERKYASAVAVLEHSTIYPTVTYPTLATTAQSVLVPLIIAI
jgi:hypothetical protein